MRTVYTTIVSLLLLLGACTPGANNKVKDTSTSGSITIASDHEFELLTKAEIDVFTYLYTNSKIRPVYKTEDSAFDLLLKDSVRLIVASRKLTAQEENYFNNKKLYPEQVKIASDALAFIVNNKNSDTLLTTDELKAIFGGQDSLWQQLNNKGGKGKITVVFDYNNSANASYIQQKLMQGKRFPSYCFALHGNRQVIDYVSKNENAVGIIGVNWISNEYDTTTIEALKAIKVVSLSSQKSSSSTDYYKPWPEYIATGQYPLSRDIYIISREAYTGLGSGFLSFVKSDKGQRIIFREGLLPVRMPSHNIHF